jgi:hypothetical protein
MNFKDKLNQIRTVLGMDIKLESMKLEDGVTIVEAEQFAPDFSIGIVTEEGVIAMPVGEYVLEDGKTIVVAQEGIIAEVKETEAVEEEAPIVEEEVEAKTEAPIAKRVVESVSKETFFAAIEKLTNEIEKLKSKKVVELSTEAPEAIVHNPEKKAVKVEFNKRPSTMTSTQQRIYNKLSN